MDQYTLCKEFTNVFLFASPQQFHCLIKTLNNKQTKIIGSICYNLLYNKSVLLSEKEKKILKPHLAIYIIVSDKKKSSAFRRELISRNPKSIKSLLKAFSIFNARV